MHPRIKYRNSSWEWIILNIELLTVIAQDSKSSKSKETWLVDFHDPIGSVFT